MSTPVKIRMAGYQGAASVHTRSAHLFGEELKRRLGNHVVFEFQENIIDQGYKAADLLGMVEEGSVRREADSLAVHFRVTDYQATVPVVYTGILPDLFGEGQGAVASGILNADGVLEATEVLAKHDENYMPPEVADALEKSGYDHKGKAQ